MSVKDFELRHGAVLIQIVRNPEISIKLVERDSEKHAWGMYKITDNLSEYLLYVKGTGNITESKKRKRCSFGFTPAEIEKISENKEEKLLLCLVCDDEEICLLDNKDIIEDLGLLDKTTQANIAVFWAKGSELTVKCRRKELSHKVPRNRLREFAWK